MNRVAVYLAAILLVAVIGVVLAFRFSPWPSAAIIRYEFAKNDRASEAALEKHVPPGITTLRDIAYGDGADEKLDAYFPQAADKPLPTIVWIHGGAWVAGRKEGVANYLKVLAGHAYATISLEYSRGYGSTYPKPVEQVNAALAFITRDAARIHADPEHLVLAGDSAGAQIASQVALITTDPAYAGKMEIAPRLKRDQLSAILLFSGAFDLNSVDFQSSNAWFLNTVLWAYSGSKDFLEDPRFRLASITSFVTPEFPPTFISSGNGDPLEPQATALAQKLRSLGVLVETLFFPADQNPPLPHEYQFNLDTPPGQQALNATLSFLAEVRAKRTRKNDKASRITALRSE